MQQLSFSLVNLSPAAAGEAIIYHSGNADLNKLQLTLTNTGPDLKLGGGAPVPEDQLPKGQTGLYLSFGQLLKDHGKGLRVSANGWAGAYTPSGQWALSPVSDLLLKEGDKVVFALAGFDVDWSQVTGYLTVDYLGFSGLRDNSTQRHVAVAEPPAPGNKSLHGVLYFELNQGHNEVFLTANPQEPLANGLSFSLRNGNKAEPLKGGLNTTFTISAEFGEIPGYGALCTADQGKAIKLSSAGGNGNDWTIMEKTQGEVRSWSFEPRTEVLGTEEAAIQQINLAGLVSTLEPGPTALYLSWTELPGYYAGSMSLELEKKRQPEIKLFTATPNKVVVKDNNEQKSVNLQWEVTNSPDLVLLEGASVAAKGQEDVQVSVAKSEFNLSATFGRNHSVSKRVKVDVAFATITVDPIIVDRQFLNLRGDTEVPVKVSWSVSNATTVSFSGGLISGPQNPKDEKTLQLGMAQMSPLPDIPLVYGVTLTLTATGEGGQTAQRSRTIYASILPMRMRGISEWKEAARNWAVQYPQEPVFNALFTLATNAEAPSGPLTSLEEANSETFGVVVPLLIKLKGAGSAKSITKEDCLGDALALQRIYSRYIEGTSVLIPYQGKALTFMNAYFTIAKIQKYEKLMGTDDAMQLGLYSGYPLQLVENLQRDMPAFATNLQNLAAKLTTLANASGAARGPALLAATTACEGVVKTLNGYTFG